MTNKLITLGAINLKTQKYEYPRISNKQDSYICPDCSKELILCQGNKIAWHFRHKSDKTNKCVRYNAPTESQIHKDAKMILQLLIQQNRLVLYRKCHQCTQEKEFTLPIMNNTMSVKQEHPLDKYNGMKGMADVALVENEVVLAVFEIFHTHRTQEDVRAEPWFEFKARELIEMVSEKSEKDIVRLQCIRSLRCDKCVENIRNSEIMRYNDLLKLPLSQIVKDKVNLEFFVRYHLGQRFSQGVGKKKHLRFDFHANDRGPSCIDCSDENNCILSLFRKYLPCDMYVWSYKGGLFITKDITMTDGYSDKSAIDFSGEGTVHIIMKLMMNANT